MFGLTKREQRWAAQERGMKRITELAVSRNQTNALTKIAALENENLKLQKEILELKLSGA